MITLTLDIAKVELILTVLSKAPYEVSADVIADIRNQAIPQIPEPSKTTEDTES